MAYYLSASWLEATYHKSIFITKQLRHRSHVGITLGIDPLTFGDQGYRIIRDSCYQPGKSRWGGVKGGMKKSIVWLHIIIVTYGLDFKVVPSSVGPEFVLHVSTNNTQKRKSSKKKQQQPKKKKKQGKMGLKISPLTNVIFIIARYIGRSQ